MVKLHNLEEIKNSTDKEIFSFLKFISVSVSVCLLFNFVSSELVDLQSDLGHAVLVELSPVAEEEENLQHHEERGGDEGLLPGVQQGGGPALEHPVANELQ